MTAAAEQDYGPVRTLGLVTLIACPDASAMAVPSDPLQPRRAANLIFGAP
jgi:hypothetical protein